MKRYEPRRRKLSEEIAIELERQILAGDYKPGDHLPAERKIMEAFGVGRPAVREALFALRKMGLIAVNSGEPARVTSPTPDVLINELAGSARLVLSTPDGVRMFQDARVILEVALARHAAFNATDDDLRTFADVLQRNREASNDPRAFSLTDVEFHKEIALIARNGVITAVYDGLAEWLSEQRDISILYPGSARLAVEAHSRIFDAIASRDADAAESAMRDHLAQVVHQYWAIWNGRHR